jgi:sulfur transfer protein SufE
MKFHTLALLSLALLSSSCGGVAAFIIMAPSTPSSRRLHSTLTSQLRLSNPPQDSTTTTNSNAILQSLTPELLKMTLAFRDIGDDKLRYKQLLYMATHQLPPLQHPEQVMIAANKVPGCLSTVYVDGTATYSKEKQDYVVDFVGESDGLLTKGLVALLVRYVRIIMYISNAIWDCCYNHFYYYSYSHLFILVVVVVMLLVACRDARKRKLLACRPNLSRRQAFLNLSLPDATMDFSTC